MIKEWATRFVRHWKDEIRNDWFMVLPLLGCLLIFFLVIMTLAAIATGLWNSLENRMGEIAWALSIFGMVLLVVLGILITNNREWKFKRFEEENKIKLRELDILAQDEKNSKRELEAENRQLKNELESARHIGEIAASKANEKYERKRNY